MNLLSLISGVFGLLAGDKDSSGNHVFLGEQQDDGYVESTEQYTNLGGALDNLGRKITGSGLTRAEQQANAFTAAREDLAWQRQFDASNTAYQRQVADMRAAGLNPMMAVSSSGGAAVPSASASGSVSPSGGSFNLGSIISALVGVRQAKADIALKSAEAEKLRADTEKVKSETDYFNLVSGWRAEGERLQNSLTDARIKEIDQSINESKSRVGKNAAETDAAVQRALLDNATAKNIEYMQPFLSAKASAETDVAILDAAYKQGLLDSGAIEAAVRASRANASESEVRAQVASIEKELKSKENAMTPDMLNGSWGEKAVAGLRVIVKTILGK